MTETRYATQGVVTRNLNPRDLATALADVAAHPTGLQLLRSVDGGDWEPVDIAAIRGVVAA